MNFSKRQTEAKEAEDKFVPQSPGKLIICTGAKNNKKSPSRLGKHISCTENLEIDFQKVYFTLRLFAAECFYSAKKQNLRKFQKTRFPNSFDFSTFLGLSEILFHLESYTVSFKKHAA